MKQTRRDQDGDGLRNLGEFKAGMDPRDKDSDDDGLKDGDENAGTITRVRRRQADDPDVRRRRRSTGTVTDATEIECEGG